MAKIPATISTAPTARPKDKGCEDTPNQPKWSIASDVRILAVIVSPAKAPAPTFSTKSRRDHRKRADHPA
jgi:hypothetical protein